LETGTPFSATFYKELRPAGRAILKACRYIASYENPDKEFPLRLSTGRNVYQFHTRTKTGRTALQEACPEPEVRMSAKDAEKFGVKDGEMVVVKSRRGQVEVKARVGRIAEGQVFIPFHHGYFDSTDGRARAANELTIGRNPNIDLEQTLTVKNRRMGPRFKTAHVQIRCRGNCQASSRLQISICQRETV
jgi:anaerobic selenocysteine-containing dehydrogenase